MCKQLGITLIEIPYWWDSTLSSLILTIQKHRPDIPLDTFMSNTEGSDSTNQQSPSDHSPKTAIPETEPLDAAGMFIFIDAC
jgi:hypothetical protein